MPLQETSGAATYDAFGGGVADRVYIEDVFSTWLYTGNDSTQTITNGIDLAGKGGLVWAKARTAATNHILWDTARGVQSRLTTNNTAAATAGSTEFLSSFNSSGFTITSTGSGGDPVNDARYTYASWTFRKQPKFFDVVTYTGNGSNRTISHSLGSAPGCIIVKRTDTAADWQVYHRSLSNTEYLVLNTTAAKATGATRWNSTTATSTEFSLGTDSTVNANTGTYVAYLFAHNAGGFGLSGTDNVISCGSLTTDSSGNGSVTLGYEPQWLLVKRTDAVSQWYLADNMRGMPVSGDGARLFPNLSNAESTSTSWFRPNATGFTVDSGMFASAVNLIYIAIRRGPMKVPTSGTSVFTPVATTNDNNPITTNFVTDALLENNRGGDSQNTYWWDRLRGGAKALFTSQTASESAWGNTPMFQSNTTAGGTGVFGSGISTIQYAFRRAPGFFDVVCYTGTGSATTFSHNLGVVPELMIVKDRTTAQNWAVYCAYLGGANPANRYVWLNSSNGFGGTAVYWNDTAPTASVFTVGTTASTNNTNNNFVAYLFASCPGVSKVGSYTGTGATQTIDCGFTGGARFVLIKRTDSTGDWYVWDTARGMVSGTDPSLLLNSTAAEVNANSVYTTSVGSQIVSTAAGINASGGTYIYLAIA